MVSSAAKAQDTYHFPTVTDYFPRDIIAVYDKYNDAYSKHDFGALQSLLSPHFIWVNSGKAESHQKSLVLLKGMEEFDLPAPVPSADALFKTTVTLYKVFKKANQATVLLSQRIVYEPIKIHGKIESTAATFTSKQTWEKTAEGWRLFSLSPLDYKPASNMYSITLHDDPHAFFGS